MADRQPAGATPSQSSLVGLGIGPEISLNARHLQRTMIAGDKFPTVERSLRGVTEELKLPRRNSGESSGLDPDEWREYLRNNPTPTGSPRVGPARPADIPEDGEWEDDVVDEDLQ